MPSHKMKSKIALIGESGVGKTSLIRRFVLDEFDDKYLHTVGTKVTKINLTIPHGADTEIDMDMAIFDIMGQKGFRDMIKETFFLDAQGVLAVCDYTNRASLDALQDWIATALEIAGDVPVYILVNKYDRANEAAFGEEAISRAAKPWEAPFIYTSARTGDSVDDAFNALAIEIVNNAMRTIKARSVAVDIENRLLEALALRGFLGYGKNDLFARFKGIAYDELKSALERLERQALVQLSWRGPEEFSAVITPKGVSAIRDRSGDAGTSAIQSVR
ncbi:MAG TPA: Rab family GTPase [Thermoplasmata archaeon]|jgi:small GTP-binding protein|nr:Rab family GTPase [Thermoplasmata archaeon]